MEEPRTFEELVGVMDRLRDPGGCPWDREQTFETLRAYLLEECYEVAEALDAGDRDHLLEELGDLLFQIVFLSRLAKEEGRFAASDVVRAIGAKIVRRHPHVFGDAEAATTEDVLRNWEEIKRREKQGASRPAEEPESVLGGVPRALPALQKAQRLGTKAARVGFDWNGAEAAFGKVTEEMQELASAVASDDRNAAREEIGDLLFSIVMLARHLAIDPEEALERTNAKFRSRFVGIERELREQGIAVENAGLPLLDRLWNDAKRREG